MSGSRESLLGMCQGRASLGEDTFDGDDDDVNDNVIWTRKLSLDNGNGEYKADVNVNQDPRGAKAKVETAICEGGGDLSGDHHHHHNRRHHHHHYHYDDQNYDDFHYIGQD